MANAPWGIVDRLRQPGYTGQNRCLPCTAVNLVIAAVVAGGVAVAASEPFGVIRGTTLGGALFVLFGAVIYLRGYLVPGTPWLTKTYFPDWLLRRFGKEAPAQGAQPDEDFDIERALEDAGAVTECEDRDDLCLTEEFRAAWWDRIEHLRRHDTTREDLAAVLEVDPERLSFEEYGDAFVARLDGRHAGRWESHAAFLADVGAAHALRERSNGWDTLDVQSRSSLLNGLRIFLERCPACDSPVTVDEEVVESCCRSVAVVAVTCRDCGARVFEAEQP